MLEIQNLSCTYGEMRAVQAVSLEVQAGQVVALLGPNGAGKSSTIQCVAGHVEQRFGSIRFKGEDISHLPPTMRVALGVAVAPEGRRLFPDLTVLENLVIGGYCRPKSREAGNMQRVLDLFPRLKERLYSPAKLLSGGEQQMTSIGRAMMSEPSLMMIDELSLGLMPKMVDVCYEAIDQLRNQGFSILIVEQNTTRALDVSDYVYVLQSGNIVWQGVPELEKRHAIFNAYLGGNS